MSLEDVVNQFPVNSTEIENLLLTYNKFAVSVQEVDLNDDLTAKLVFRIDENFINRSTINNEAIKFDALEAENALALIELPHTILNSSFFEKESAVRISYAVYDTERLFFRRKELEDMEMELQRDLVVGSIIISASVVPGNYDNESNITVQGLDDPVTIVLRKDAVSRDQYDHIDQLFALD